MHQLVDDAQAGGLLGVAARPTLGRIFRTCHRTGSAVGEGRKLRAQRSVGWHVVEMEWKPRIDVTTSEILAAKNAWLAAQCNGASPSRVAELRRGYIELLRT